MNYEELIALMGYAGCRNCEFQIEPLRMCEWAEKNSDNQIHLICPMWKKRGEEE